MYYNAEDIFEDIPGNTEHCTMKLPPEVIEALNLKNGDKVTIIVEDDTIIIKKS